MDRMIHKAMPIFIVEMPERRLSDHGNQRLTRPKTATARDRGSVTVCFRPRSRHFSCYEAVIQRLSKAATMRSRLERIV